MTGIVYYLSIIGSVFLTIQAIRENAGATCADDSSYAGHCGGRQSGCGQIPLNIQFDLADNQLYTITDQTKEFVKDWIRMWMFIWLPRADRRITDQKVLERYESVQSYQNAQRIRW
ncbi:MAG: hypothetical protein ACLS2X_09190 [Coprococcus sp.]